MKRILPFALMLVACGPSGGDGDHLPDSGATSKPTETSSVTPTPEPTAVKLGANPNRTHQLDSLKKVKVDIKGHPVHLWVMDTESKRAEGMMFLTDGEVKADEGMLFRFDEPEMKVNGRGFWMHNTLIPLDIIYVGPSGQIVSIGQGKPKDDTTVEPEGDFQDVIELKAGTAAKYGLKPGDRVELPAR